MTDIRLSHIAPGYARVRRFAPITPGAAFGFSTPLGEVRRRYNNRWLAYDETGSSVGGWHRTRQAAVDYLDGLTAVRAHIDTKEQSA